MDPITGAAIGASVLGGLFGKNKEKQQVTSQTGFQALPKQVQDFLLQQQFPKIQEQANAPYAAVPMQRVKNPAGDPFGSQGLYDLQKYSDAVGGLFNPIGLRPGGMQGMQPTNPAANPMAANSQLAQQFLSSAPQGSFAGGNPVFRGMGELQTGMSQGRYGLAELGQALTGQGYGQTTFQPSGINFGLLAATLAKAGK